ncbi:hypothetical protein [Streptomyces cinereoruber]|uniref:hypothetical protein n=1 Tax=Streptomyces cinereoruber TaxID=67260 RepID=UPI00364A8A4C
MEIYIENTGELCPLCGERKVRQRREQRAWGGTPIVKYTRPYCNSGCTRQELDAYEREQAEND